MRRKKTTATRKNRAAKTPEQLQIEANLRKRNRLIASGIPAHQVEGDKVHEFETNVRFIRRPVQNIVDRWVLNGGIGFAEPQARAIEHCRQLWEAAGSEGKLVANLHWIGGGGGGREGHWQQAEALAQLVQYRREFLTYWEVFEDIVRWNIAPATAGGPLGTDKNGRLERCKLVVGMVASVIAARKGY